MKKRLAKISVALIGAPTDVGAGVPGAREGPSALRACGVSRELEAAGCDVLDMGDCSGPPNPEGEPRDGYRNLAEVAAWCSSVKAACSQALELGRVPVLLGGDHCLAIGSLGAVAESCERAGRRLRVLWLDAHADFNTARTTPSGNMHGMPLSALCEAAPDLVAAVARPGALSAADLRLIGVRSVDEGEARAIGRLGVWVLGVGALRERGAEEAAGEALAGWREGDHLHVSFDVDFLDPEDAPGVGTRVEGGPTLAEARALMDAIGARARVGSLDIVELNPSLDVDGKTALRAVELAVRLFRPRGSDAPAGAS